MSRKRGSRSSRGKTPSDPFVKRVEIKPGITTTIRADSAQLNSREARQQQVREAKERRQQQVREQRKRQRRDQLNERKKVQGAARCPQRPPRDGRHDMSIPVVSMFEQPILPPMIELRPVNPGLMQYAMIRGVMRAKQLKAVELEFSEAAIQEVERQVHDQ